MTRISKRQRVCNVRDVPLATNVSTANLIISVETV